MSASASVAVRRPRATHGHLGNHKFLSLGRTHVGCVRSLNEDAFLNRPEIGLWAVADGMGGHEAGEVASARVVETLAQVDAFGSAYAFRHGVCAALQQANSALVEYAAERLSGPVGATVVSLLAHQGHYACVWAGDSRAYLYRGGELRRLTRDHSVVQALVDAGELAQDDMRGHPRGNAITRAVGAAPALQLDGVHGRLQPGDRFLLCSDGLTAVLDDRELTEFVMRSPLQFGVDSLFAKALARGAPDNVTVVLVGVESAEAGGNGGRDALG